MIKNAQDVKTLDVKIMELREDPSNLDNLFAIISMIYENYYELEETDTEIKDFDIVNYVLANALKAD